MVEIHTCHVTVRCGVENRKLRDPTLAGCLTCGPLFISDQRDGHSDPTGATPELVGAGLLKEVFKSGRRLETCYCSLRNLVFSERLRLFSVMASSSLHELFKDICRKGLSTKKIRTSNLCFALKLQAQVGDRLWVNEKEMIGPWMACALLASGPSLLSVRRGCLRYRIIAAERGLELLLRMRNPSLEHSLARALREAYHFAIRQLSGALV